MSLNEIFGGFIFPDPSSHYHSMSWLQQMCRFLSHASASGVQAHNGGDAFSRLKSRAKINLLFTVSVSSAVLSRIFLHLSMGVHAGDASI